MLSRSGKSPEKQIFFKVRKKSRNSVSSQGNTKFYLKVSEKAGNFILPSHQVWERVSLLVKVMFQKTSTKELISVVLSLALLAKVFSSVSLKTGLLSVNSQGKVREFLSS